MTLALYDRTLQQHAEAASVPSSTRNVVVLQEISQPHWCHTIFHLPLQSYESSSITCLALPLCVPNVEVVIEGEASGADTLGREVATELGIPVLPFPAQWSRYGRAAGPIRNQQMLDEGRPDLVLVFHHNLETSKGTRDMLNRARRAGIEIGVFCPTSQRGIFQRANDRKSPGKDLDGQGRNDHRCLKLLT